MTKPLFLLHKIILFFSVFSLVVSACSPAEVPTLAAVLPTTAAAATAAPSASPTALDTLTPTVTLTPVPSLTPTSTITPTATPLPEMLPATVWTADPQVPVLLYHTFLPDSYEKSTGTKTRLADFRAHLQGLYDAGYSLVPLEAWLSGDMRVPAGRRPLVLTMDDLFTADQIFVDPDGTPSPKSGLGVLWRFANDHPDFGFHIALFYNLGNKHYANLEYGDRFLKTDGWEDALGRAIAWCIENGALPYNHFYTHPDLDLTSGKDVIWEAKQNEISLRSFLKRVGKDSLADGLGNMFALPFGKWPTSLAVRKLMFKYVSTNSKPLLAILDADCYTCSFRATFLPAVYAATYDRWHIPRIAASDDAIRLLGEKKDQFVTAAECKLGPLTPGQTPDAAAVQAFIAAAGQSHSCPDGVYAVNGWMFRLQDAQVTRLEINMTTKEIMQ